MAKWGQIFTFDISAQTDQAGEIMARSLRVEFEGALYHLTGRGNARQKVFADEADCAKFVQLLVELLERYDVALHGYVLMGNHYHFDRPESSTQPRPLDALADHGLRGLLQSTAPGSRTSFSRVF